MGLNFQWDPEKSRANFEKHGVSFDEASTVFGDPLELTIPDLLHSVDEDRFISIGLSGDNRILVVVYTERQDDIRIISARRATARERRQYEEGI